MLDKFSKFVGVPETLIGKGVSMELHNNHEAVITGCEKILEYTDRSIRISTKTVGVKFTGSNLAITSLDNIFIIIKGEIQSIEYITI